jgi:hypothetical protein
MSDIKIERVEVDVSASGQIYNLQTPVDLSKAFIRLVGPSDHSTGGPVGNTSNAGPNDMGVGAVWDSGTQIAFYPIGTGAGPYRVKFEVWRYEGPEDGPYEFRSLFSGANVLHNGSFSSSLSLSISDRNKVIPFHLGYRSSETSNSNFESVVIAIHVNDNDEVVCSRNNSGTGVTAICYYQVVEFIGSGWSVGHGVSTNHDSSPETVTMNTDSTGVGGSTFDVGDWSNAFIADATMEGDSAETGISDCLAMVYPCASTTQAIFSVTDGDSNARNDGVGYFHVLKADDMRVFRDNGAITEGNNTYGTIPAPSGVSTTASLSEVSLEWFVDSSGTGTAHGRGRLVAELQSTVYAQFEQGETIDPSSFNRDQDVEIILNNVIFPSSPEGTLIEMGGGGNGLFVGFSGSYFVARAGNGSDGVPADTARFQIPSGTYDFSNKLGSMYIYVDYAASNIKVSFDENSTGTFDLEVSSSASSSFSLWSGTADGGLGTTRGQVAGSESSLDFNGSIGTSTIASGSTEWTIQHWVHRSGNSVIARYGIVDLTNLEYSPPITSRRIFII